MDGDDTFNICRGKLSLSKYLWLFTFAVVVVNTKSTKKT